MKHKCPMCREEMVDVVNMKMLHDDTGSIDKQQALRLIRRTMQAELRSQIWFKTVIASLSLVVLTNGLWVAYTWRAIWSSS